MPTRLFAFVIGLLYGLIGVLSFIRPFVWPPPDRVQYLSPGIIAGYGFLFGYLPVNWVLAGLYILIGAAGLLLAVVYTTALAYSRGMMGLMFGLLLLSITPFFSVQTLWGLLPLFAWNTPVYLLTALLAWYFGFIHEPEPAST